MSTVNDEPVEQKDIKEIYVDNLSDCDYMSENEHNGPKVLDTSDSEVESSDGDTVIPRKRLCQVLLQFSDSENEEETVDDMVWSKTDVVPELKPFEGNPGLKRTLSSKTVSDVVNLFIGDDLFQFMAKESNRYHVQNHQNYKESKSLRWVDITAVELQKFLGLILLMGQVRKDTMYDYWTAQPSIETPFFPKTMSRNRFQQIWQAWHFCNNDDIIPGSNRLIKIQPITKYFADRFKHVYKPQQHLSLEESIIPWRGKLAVKTSNASKLVKHGLLARLLCEATTGYICNFELYTGEEEKLNKSILTMLEPYYGLWHHVYQDNYYNGVGVVESLLRNKTHFCGMVKTSLDLPQYLRDTKITKGQSIFLRKEQILLQAWNSGKQNVNTISTMHSARIIETGKIDRKSGELVKKPEAVAEFEKYIKQGDRAGHYLLYYSVLRKTSKWTKRAVLFLFNCALFNAYKIYTQLNGGTMKYKKFLHAVALEWLTDRVIQDSTSEEEVETPASSLPTKRAPKYDPPGRLSMNLRNHRFKKIISNGRQAIPQRQCRVCAAHKKRSRTSYYCEFCCIPLHRGTCFERYHTLQDY